LVAAIILQAQQIFGNKMLSLSHYHHQAVRDLAWSCFGPDIIQNYSALSADGDSLTNPIALTEQRLHWLTQLDRNPAPLEAHLSSLKNSRLGLYFEALWHFFLQQDEEIELLANNLPVREHKQTLGEFDLIIYHPASQQYQHLELAVKFYLYCADSRNQQEPYAAFSHWLGPSCRDRFDRKLQHLLERQSQLSKLPAGQQVIEELGISKLSQHIILKGNLFSRVNQACLDNPAINPATSQYHWLPINEFYNYFSNQTGWKIQDKPNWLSPAFYSERPELQSTSYIHQALRQHFQNSIRPRMLVRLEPGPEGFYEHERIFVTDDNWPDSFLKD
jgi:hypothetical protein